MSDGSKPDYKMDVQGKYDENISFEGQVHGRRRQPQILSFEQELIGQEKNTTLWSRAYRHRGILYVLFAVFLTSLHSMMVKFYKDLLDPMEVSFIRFFMQLALPVPIMVHRGISPLPESPKILLMLVVRSLLGMVALTSLFCSFYFIRVGDATAITYANPVLVGIFARIFLKEAFGLLEALLVGTVLCGVFLISQPPFLLSGSEENGVGDSSSQFIGAMLAFVTATCLSVTTILISKMGQLQVNSSKIVLYYAAIAAFGTAVLTTIVGGWSIPPCGWIRFSLVLMGIFNCSSQILITHSLSLESSVFVAILRTNEVLFAYLLEFLIFDVYPNIWAIIGVALVLSASTAASLKKMWISKRKGIAKARRLSQMSRRVSEVPAINPSA